MQKMNDMVPNEISGANWFDGEKVNRYIDASILESAIDKYSERLLSHKLIPILYEAVLGVLDDIRFLVKIQQPIEVVPVVRCKDCKWGKETCGNIECFVYLNAPSEYHGYDWYCPNGEKR